MTDTLPDRLSTNPKSPYHDAEVLARDVGIRFKGEEKTNVEEYCVSEGWIRVAAGNAKDRHGDRGQNTRLHLDLPRLVREKEWQRVLAHRTLRAG